jgi:carboxylesterase type B
MKLFTVLAGGLFGSLSSALQVSIPGVGNVNGFVCDDDPAVASFLGLPYSRPPTGANRFQPPAAPAPWTTVRDATEYGATCMQPPGVDSNISLPQSEDCLFLNVFTPIEAIAKAQKLPVMLWIHGGAYVNGESNDYPGEGLVNQSACGLVVVTINYRLNVFGFLGSDAISATTANGGSGNFGIQDQRMAMQFVKEHIAAFGGDGDDITIFGESAGGNSVINHLAQPDSFPLYTKAIVESGTYDTGAKTLAAANAQYASVLAGLSCAGVSCLRALDAGKLLAQVKLGSSWAPVVDGRSLAAAPTDLIEAGQFNNKVPVMMGSNRDEYAFFALLFKVPPQLTKDEMDALLLSTGSSAQDVLELGRLYAPAAYPFPQELGPYSLHWWTYMRIQTDLVPGLGPCGARWLARALTAGGSPSVHVYLFAHPAQVALPQVRQGGGGCKLRVASCVSHALLALVNARRALRCSMRRQSQARSHSHSLLAVYTRHSRTADRPHTFFTHAHPSPHPRTHPAPHTAHRTPHTTRSLTLTPRSPLANVPVPGSASACGATLLPVLRARADPRHRAGLSGGAARLRDQLRVRRRRWHPLRAGAGV